MVPQDHGQWLLTQTHTIFFQALFAFFFPLPSARRVSTLVHQCHWCWLLTQARHCMFFQAPLLPTLLSLPGHWYGLVTRTHSIFFSKPSSHSSSHSSHLEDWSPWSPGPLVIALSTDSVHHFSMPPSLSSSHSPHFEDWPPWSPKATRNGS